MKHKEWAPAQVFSLTIPQILCLISEKPPGRRTLANVEEYRRMLEERERAVAAWLE
ncbi:hypothetical protein [Singulisphaera sp. PoT]|uniref:hypothetical protein n=1 Tax=Singulisphaera sp. PoT TaxID=3411797 RepID=UPI003BF4D9E9